eukprot:s4410_g1.t1
MGFLILLLVIILVGKDDYLDYQTETKAAEGTSTQKLASSSFRRKAAVESWTSSSIASASGSSLQRPELPCGHSRSHGFQQISFLEVQKLHGYQRTSRPTLLAFWRSLGRRSGQKLPPKGCQSSQAKCRPRDLVPWTRRRPRRRSCYMEPRRQASEESPTAPQSEVAKKESVARRIDISWQSWTSRDRIWLACDCSLWTVYGNRAQRERQGEAADGCSNGSSGAIRITATTAPTSAYASADDECECNTMDAAGYVEQLLHAVHAPACGNTCPAGCDGDSYDSILGRADRGTSSTEAVTICQDGSEGGQSLSRLSGHGARGDKERQHAEVAQHALCCGWLDKAKDKMMEIENARNQLWGQWKLFLQQSVTKWQEYTSQFQASEIAFTQQIEEATVTLRRAQRNFDAAKRNHDAVDQEEAAQIISDEEEDMDVKDEAVDIPKDENAQKIQEGLQAVVHSLTELSESAEKLEPKPKRPRKEEEDAGDGGASRGAIENAHHLAVELGELMPLSVDSFSLPLRAGRPAKTLRFDDNVVVYDDESPTSSTSMTSSISDECIGTTRRCSKTPWTAAMNFDEGDTGGTAPSGSGSSRPTSSEPLFFDRRVPDEYPNYLHHLHHLWHERGESLAEDEYYRLRTWYVHHDHHTHCRLSRIVELEGDGSTWHQDILSAWPDRVRPHEALQIAVVFPQLRHFGTGRIVHADIILLQGNPVRFGGITTVYPYTGDDQARYVWAVSFPHHLSGNDILAGADALPLPADHYCDIMRPTLGNYFGMVVGSGIIFTK